MSNETRVLNFYAQMLDDEASISAAFRSLEYRRWHLNHALIALMFEVPVSKYLRVIKQLETMRMEQFDDSKMIHGFKEGPA